MISFNRFSDFSLVFKVIVQSSVAVLSYRKMCCCHLSTLDRQDICGQRLELARGRLLVILAGLPSRLHVIVSFTSTFTFCIASQHDSRLIPTQRMLHRLFVRILSSATAMYFLSSFGGNVAQPLRNVRFITVG